MPDDMSPKLPPIHHCEQSENQGPSDSTLEDDLRVSAASAYLENLNSEQRRAVEHGVLEKDCNPRSPLLVIAGAGSGKTNTLAHRVAHLIVNGADPRRILLMTFSRRAASEMTKRVERIARKVMGDNAVIMTDALHWAGTFTESARGSSGSIQIKSASILHSRSTIAKIPLT